MASGVSVHGETLLKSRLKRAPSLYKNMTSPQVSIRVCVQLDRFCAWRCCSS